MTASLADKVSVPFVKGDILLVDDTLDNLRLLATMLRNQGYKVRSAKSGAMAIAGVKAAPPELILLDITMPNMDGYEVCQQLKTDVQTHEIPIIFISALDEAIDKVKAFAVGGVDYITKPFQIEEVVARIEHQLTIQRLQKKLKEQNTDLQIANIKLQEMNAQLEAEIQERQRAQAALQKANQELERLASLDGLTKVANRRQFDRFFSTVWQQASQDGTALTSILCDVDYFKGFNDTYGHQAGDDCLQQIAQAIQDAVKRSGCSSSYLVARYGGEEFVVVVSQADIEVGWQVATAIQTGVADLAIPHQASTVSTIVSLSIGVASIIPAPQLVPEALIQASDQALYRAKQAGRNRIMSQSL